MSQSGSKQPDRNATPDSQSGPGPESREMFTEITSLMAALAKALAMSEADTVAALDRGEITLAMNRDANGNPFVAATRNGVTARVYQGAIKREAGPT